VNAGQRIRRGADRVEAFACRSDAAELLVQLACSVVLYVLLLPLLIWLGSS